MLHQITYDDNGRTRSILHRASISEMVVPYGDPGELHGWKNAFDAGEWGLGRMTQPLTLGCDCLGEIHYFDATLANEQGKPWVINNAICMHEEDYGILWKHVDLQGGRSEVRRSRRLVVSFIATVGNYEYGFFWYFYLDGNIQLEVKLTGHRVADGDRARHAARVRERDRGGRRRAASPAHVQRPARLRRRRRRQRGVRGRRRTHAGRPRQPVARTRSASASTRFETEPDALRETDSAHSRTWRIANPTARNGLGQPTAYKLVPTMARPRCWRIPTRRSVAAPASRSTTSGSRRTRPKSAARPGSIPNQHAGGDGLPRWTAQDRAIAGTDVVVWYSFGVTHFVRPEDWPVMPVEYTGFTLDAVRVLRSQPRARRSRERRALRTPIPPRERTDGQVDTGRVAAGARSLRGGRAGGRAAPATGAPWAEHVHRRRDLRRASLRHVRRARGAATRGSPRRWRSGRTRR